MRKLFQNRRFFSLAIFGVIFLALLVAPTTTHACYLWCLDDILDAILSVVTVVKAMLGQLLDRAGKALQWSLSMSMQAILGLQVIDSAWRVMRDLANFVFIIMLVVISFSTILNVIPSLQKYHYSKALKGVIIAALLMNFSLAIGKTVVLASDQVARLVINIMPNLGDDLVKTIQPQVAILNPDGLSGPLPSNPGADVTKTLTAAEDKRYKECLKEEIAITARARVWRFLVNAPRSGPGSTPITTKGIGECAAEVQAARRASSAVTANLKPDAADEAAAEKLKASASSTTPQQKIFLIVSGLLSSLLILILTLCLITPFLFILLRVLMLWILLFSSPIAWASYAIPGTDFFKKWWDLFLGWNLFGPVYLFAIIPGMIVLQGSGELLTGLGTGGVDIGTTSGLFQIFMFHAFAILIFLGGLGVAMKSSFAGAVKGTAGLGWVAGKIGVGDETGLGGAKLAGRFTKTIGKYTGANAYLEAAKARAQQEGAERLNRGKLGRIFQAVKPASDAERTAAARARLGVTGGAPALAALKAEQVKKAQKTLGDETYGMNNANKESHLRGRMRSPDKAVALAAREELLKMNKLTRPEIDATSLLYPEGPARTEFDARARGAANRVAQEAKKKKEERTAEISAQLDTVLERVPPPTTGEISTLLGAYTNADEKKAFEEHLAKKSPTLLVGHKVSAAGGGMSRDNAIRDSFDHVLKNPDDLLKLDPGNFFPTSDLARAVELFYPDPATLPAAQQARALKRRDNFREDLLRRGGLSMQTNIENILP